MRKAKVRTKQQEEVKAKEVFVKLLKAPTVNLGHLIKATKIPEISIVFAVGPAGTGKTYTATSCAIDALNAGLIKQIILTRAYVPAGESYGHLPGTIDEKFAPYLAPYIQVFKDRVGIACLERMIKDGRVLVVPIGFLQGMTFNDACILVDEAENCTFIQLKLILTRLGYNCKAFFMGDKDQSYIRNSGLMKVVERLQNLHITRVIRFTIKDSIRSESCQLVLEALEDLDGD